MVIVAELVKRLIVVQEIVGSSPTVPIYLLFSLRAKTTPTTLYLSMSVANSIFRGPI